MSNFLRISLYGLVFICGSWLSLGAQVVCTYTAANDLCEDAIQIGGAAFAANTCCGNIEGINLCNSTETGVWYYYDQSMSASLVTIENISISGVISVEFYSGDCSNLTLLENSDCSGFTSREFEVPNCSGRLYIHISTTEFGCGDFNISATDIQGCEFADNCADVSAAQILTPIADEVQVCASSCLNYSCISTCTDNSVWFRFDTDDLTTAIQLAINNLEFEPMISVYRGLHCGDLDDLILCQLVNPGEFIDLAVTPDYTYFVEISLGSGDPGAFDLCINAIQEYIECSAGTISVTRTENPAGNPNGPYCPGETVLFCYDLEFYVDTPAEGNGCQWLQGIVPIVGGGWDLTANDLQSQSPVNWGWFDDVDYNVDNPVLALATDGGGNTILEYGPGGLQAGDILPGGWYFVSNGTNSGCTNDGHPDNMWGINSPCGQVFTFSHCFELTARSIADITECDDAYIRDLSVTLFNFADGETGCYTSLACSGDTPVKFEATLDCSNLVTLAATGDMICSGEYLEAPVWIEGGYEIPLKVEVVDAGNTSGAQDWVFESGTGIIPDQIINNGNSIETITYLVSFNDNDSECNSPTLFFDVIVLPEFSFEMDTSHVICEGDILALSAPSGYDAYEWYNAETNDFIQAGRNLQTDTSAYYRIEITEGICTATEIIHVQVNERLPLALDVSELNVCDNYIGTLSTSLDLESLQLNDVEGIWYDENNSVVTDPSVVDFTGMNEGTYAYSFQTTSALVPCPDTLYDLDIIVEHCECPAIDVIAPDNFCALSQVYDLNSINIGSDPGSWAITAGPVIGSIDINGTDMFIFDNTVGGLYSLSYTLDDPNIAPLCSTDTTVQFFVFAEPEALIQPSGLACNVYTGTEPEILDLDDFNLSNSSGVWSTNEAGLTIDSDNVVSFMGMDPQDYVFYFDTDDAISPCVNYQYQTVITVLDCSCPDTDIAPLDDMCLEAANIDLVSLQITDAPGIWSIESGPDTGSMQISGDFLEITESTVTGDYTLRFTLSDMGIGPLCPMYSEIGLTINPPVEVDIAPSVELCNVYTGTLQDTLDLDDLISTSNAGVWTSDSGSIVIESGNIVRFTESDVDDFIFRYTTTDAIFPCENMEYETIVSVIDCACPDTEITSLDDQCIDELVFDLDALKITTEDGLWSVESGPDINSIELTGSELMIHENTAEGTYTFRYSLTASDIGPLCPSYSEFSVNFYQEVDADIIPSVELCNEYTGTLLTSLDLDDLIVTSNSGSWFSEDPSIAIDGNNMIDLSAEAIQAYRFYYMTDDAQAPCVDKAYYTEVNLLDCSCPDTEITDLADQCIEDMVIDLSLLKVTTEDGIWSIESGADVSSLVLNGEELLINDSSVEGNYTLRFSLTDPNIGPLCQMYSEIDFKLSREPFADIVNSGELCNEDTGTLSDQIDLDDYNLNDASGVWSSTDPDVQIGSDNVVEFITKDIRSYSFSFTTDTAEDPCMDQEYELLVELRDCSCPSVAVNSLDDQCIEDMVIDLSLLQITTEEGEWELRSGADVNSVQIMDDELIITDQSVEGMYTLRFSLTGSDYGPDCITESEISFSIYEEPFANILSAGELCNEDTGTLADFIDLDDYNLSGSSGVWTSSDPGVDIAADNEVEFLTKEIRDYVFVFETNTAQAPCVDQVYELSVSMMDCSCPDTEISELDDQCIDDVSIDLSDLQVTLEPGIWSVISGPDIASLSVVGSELMISDQSVEGEYTLRFSLTGTDYGPDCITESEISFNIYEEPFADISPFGEACNEDTGTLADFIDLDDYNLNNSSGSWSSMDPDVIIDVDNRVDFITKEIRSYDFEFLTDTAQDPCVDQVYNLSVDLIDCSCPSVDLSPIGDMCIEETILDLNDHKLTPEDGLWSLSAGPDIGSVELLGDQLRIMESSVSGLYTLTFELANTNIGPDCPVNSSIDFLLISAPDADIQEQVVTCNLDTGAEDVILDLDDMNLSGSSGIWESMDPAFNIDADNVVDFEGATPGSYVFEFTTDTAQDPCMDQSYVLNVNVKDCACPNIVVIAPDDFCQEAQTFDLNQLLIDADAGVWELSSGASNIPQIAVDQLIISDDTSIGEYMLSYSLTEQNIPPDCVTSIDLEFEIFAEPSAQIVETAEVCNKYIGSLEISLDLDEQFISGDQGDWFSTNSLLPIDSDNIVDFSGIDAGDYEFIYRTNAAQPPCSDTEYILTVSVRDCECPLLELQDIPDLCSDDNGLDLSAFLVSDNPGFWSISPDPNSQFEINTSSVLSYDDSVDAGDYILTYTFDDISIPSLCNYEVSVNFEIIQAPYIEVIPDFIACNATDSGFAPVEIDLDDFVSGDDGNWMSMNPEAIINADGEVSFEGIDPGEYPFIYTSNTAQGPCDDVSMELVVTVEDCVCPVILFEESPNLCDEELNFDLSSLLASGVDPGSWTQIDGPEQLQMGNGDLVSIDGALSGIYYFEYTLDDAVPMGCINKDTSYFEVIESLEFEVQESVLVCNQYSSLAEYCIDLTSMVNGASGIWEAPSNYDNDFSDIRNICFEGYNEGDSFIFRFTSTEAVAPCPDKSEDLLVEVMDCSCPIIELLQPDPMCNDLDTYALYELVGDSTVSGQWIFMEGPETVQFTNDSMIVLEGLTEGEYIFNYVPYVTPASSCPQYAEISLSVMQAYSAGEGSQVEFCQGEDVELNLYTLLIGYDNGGAWSDVSLNNSAGNSFNPDNGILSIRDLEPGLYEMMYLMVPEFPCPQSEAYIDVLIHENPIADAGQDNALKCDQTEIYLGGPEMSIGNNIQYIWTELNQGVELSMDISNPLIDAEGLYQVEVINTVTGCNDIDEVLILNEIEELFFDAEVMEFECFSTEGGTIMISNQQGGSGDYIYSINNGVSWSSTPMFDGLDPGNYSVLMQDSDGCEHMLDGLVVIEPVSINVWAGEDVEIEYSEDLYTVELHTDAEDEEIAYVLWEMDGEVVCEGSIDQCYYIDVDPYQFNEVCVTLTDINGCQETDCMTITELIEVKVYIPNVFNPTLFTNNGMFFVQSNEYVSSITTFRIFDRWGGIVFERIDAHEPNIADEGWDGYWMDRIVQPGVYTYHVIVEDVFGESHSFAGEVTLIR